MILKVSLRSLTPLTKYVFRYMGKSIVFENSFDKKNYTDVMLSPAYLVFHSQVFKKFKPVKGKRGVKKMRMELTGLSLLVVVPIACGILQESSKKLYGWIKKRIGITARVLK
jgi:hypothetical protein